MPRTLRVALFLPLVALGACSINTAPSNPPVAVTPAPSPVVVQPQSSVPPGSVVVQPRAY
jgi:hypothetical protein